MTSSDAGKYVCYVCREAGRVIGFKQGVKAVRCRRCGFVWKDLASLPAGYRQSWRYGSKESSEIRNSEKVYSYRLQQILDAGHAEISKVLDFGCGSGGFVTYLRGKGMEAYGCDLGDNIPAEAHFFKMNIAEVSEGDFDAVVSIETFEHLTDLNMIVGELAKRLKTGGILYVQTHFTHVDSILGWGYFDLANHISFHNPKSMKILMNNAGLELVYHDSKVPRKDLLWVMRKLVHLSHATVPAAVQQSHCYRKLLAASEKIVRLLFRSKVAVQPCDDYVSGVLKVSNCVFVGRKV